MIEDICIEKTINLSDELILNDIREIPINIVNNLESRDENVLLPNEDNNNISGKNVLDYNINNVLNEFINDN